MTAPERDRNRADIIVLHESVRHFTIYIMDAPLLQRPNTHIKNDASIHGSGTLPCFPYLSHLSGSTLLPPGERPSGSALILWTINRLRKHECVNDSMFNNAFKRSKLWSGVSTQPTRIVYFVVPCQIPSNCKRLTDGTCVSLAHLVHAFP